MFELARMRSTQPPPQLRLAAQRPAFLSRTGQCRGSANARQPDAWLQQEPGLTYTVYFGGLVQRLRKAKRERASLAQLSLDLGARILYSCHHFAVKRFSNLTLVKKVLRRISKREGRW